MSSRYWHNTINSRISKEKWGKYNLSHYLHHCYWPIIYINPSWGVISLLFLKICELIRFHTSLRSSWYSTFRQEDEIHFPGTVRQISLLEYVLTSDSPANESLQFNIAPSNRRHGLILIRSHNKKGNQKFTLCHYNKDSSCFSIQNHHRPHKFAGV